ncbi:MAG: Ig-like domain-containing protein [Myxococcales bacterium]|nr:Ig-like domain-containing protein [Myxococcales bacterium]
MNKALHLRKQPMLSVVMFLLIFGACQHSVDVSESAEQPPPEPAEHVETSMHIEHGVTVAEGDRENETKPGVHIRIGQAEAQAEAPARPSVAKAQPLGDAEIVSLLTRLPEVVTAADDKQEFQLRAQTMPPPKPGTTVTTPFPPPPSPDAAPAVDLGPLEVLRFAPEGDVPMSPHLTVTFSQPMVPLTTFEELKKLPIPVTLVPTPPGEWRWLGTKTVLFEPQRRFPMATEYVVTIPKGTRSAAGATLAADKSWTFRTPPPTVEFFHPTDGPHPLEPVMVVRFDQRVDKNAVLAVIRVTDGGKTVPIRLATDAEIQADQTAAPMMKDNEEGRVVCFRAVSPFSPDSTISVDIGPQLPSAEGPRKTTEGYNTRFSTYSPLRLVETRCGWGDDCAPMAPWYLEMNNPLDAAAFDESLISVEPLLDGKQIEVMGSSIVISGRSKGRTQYKITLRAGILDQFGQKLAKDVSTSVKVGSAPPSLYVGGEGYAILDPFGKPELPIFTVNHGKLNIVLYTVQPDDLPAYLKFLQESWRDTGRPKMPGKKSASFSVSIPSDPDNHVESKLDLSAALRNGRGMVVAEISPPRGLGGIFGLGQREEPVRVWVQSTAIGLTAFVDGDQMIVWATRLSDGAPLDGVSLRLIDGSAQGKTDASGLAVMSLPDSATGNGVLIATLGDDQAILRQQEWMWGDGGTWVKQSRYSQLLFYVVDDRKMYRPKEEVHIKGWIRTRDASKAGMLGASGATAVTYRLRDSQWNEIGVGEAQVNTFGGFQFKLTLPDNMNLGAANVEITANGAVGGSVSHSFEVQEFRRPEYEVAASHSGGPFEIGGFGLVTTTAKYFAGGGLPNADVHWNVTSRPTVFSPPNRDEFSFGTWVPWWERDGNDEDGTLSLTFDGKTDAAGEHTIRLDFDAVEPPRPLSVEAEAQVMDVNRQAWSAGASLLVHPSANYVGLRPKRAFFEAGQPVEVDAIVVDHDGAAVAGIDVDMQFVRLEWKWKGGVWKTVESGVQHCKKTSGADVIQCVFKPEDGGQFRIKARVKDTKGRANESTRMVWVAGGKQPSAKKVELERVTLVPDKKEYQPGDTAEILVQAPFSPAEGIFSVRRDGVWSHEKLKMDGATTTLKIKIVQDHIPNLIVQVDLVGQAARTADNGSVIKGAPPRPAFASGSLDLAVPPTSRTLTLDVVPKDKALEPGGKTQVTVSVKDASGKPVSGGEVLVIVVDEAVLSLTGYVLPDPVSAFYPTRSSGVSDYHSRKNVLLAALDQAQPTPQEGKDKSGALFKSAMGGAPGARMAEEAVAAPAPMMLAEKKADGGGGAVASTPIRVRTSFDPLAVFSADNVTDADGRAVVNVTMPDNLTRYRVMAVATAGAIHFGKGEAAIVARLPLMVRPSAPRFLNFGDVLEFPVVLQNQTDAPMDVSVALRVGNLKLTDGAGRKVTVAANDRVEVRFPAAAEQAGTARVQIAAAAGSWADAAEVSLPVWTPATTEAFATYGEIDKGAISQPVAPPGNVWPQFGGLTITTSSTAVQALTDAVLYLVAYPFECSEQISSRILAIAALRDVLDAFDAEGLPPKEELVNRMTADIEMLSKLQGYSGGFGFWRRSDEAWPYLTVHVMHALARAKQKGFDVPDHVVSNGLSYLKNIENYYTHWYSDEVRWSISSYALYVRKRHGDVDTKKAKKLLNGAGVAKLPLEATGWLWFTMTGDADCEKELATIRKHVQNRVEETAGAAHFTSSYSDGAYLLLHSDRRTDAVLLEAMIEDTPKSDVIPKVVRGLLAHRKKGRWGNTQENAFVLLALDRYFAVFEKETPDFVARAWLGDQFAGEHRFEGRTTESHDVNIPMSWLADKPESRNLVVAKDGPGRLYYRLGLRYAPKSLSLDPMDRGFAIQRTYEGVDNKDDVTRNPDGVWVIKAGSRVRVKLAMVAEARRYHVALVDPLPAGLEPMNPALAVTGNIPQDKDAQKNEPYWWWWRPWYEHQNMRDERVEAFTPMLWEGVYTYDYVARATTPGRFVTPPTRAEEMYMPETFGRGGTDVVVVQDVVP